MENRTQIAHRPAGANAPLVLKFRVQPKYLALIAKFLEVKERSKKETDQLTTMRVKQVGKEEAFAYDRKDAVGNKQADTGTEMFYVGKPGNALTFACLLEDMEATGYNLIDVRGYQKDNDKMAFVSFSFNQEKGNEFPVCVTDLLKTLAAMSWENVHIWNNPNGSITINAAHIMNKTASKFHMDRTNAEKSLISAKKKVSEEGIYFTIHFAA